MSLLTLHMQKMLWPCRALWNFLKVKSLLLSQIHVLAFIQVTSPKPGSLPSAQGSHPHHTERLACELPEDPSHVSLTSLSLGLGTLYLTDNRVQCVFAMK